jgi:hypothetical protein
MMRRALSTLDYDRKLKRRRCDSACSLGGAGFDVVGDPRHTASGWLHFFAFWSGHFAIVEPEVAQPRFCEHAAIYLCLSCDVVVRRSFN